MDKNKMRYALAELLGWKWYTGFYAGQNEDGAWRFLSEDGCYSDGYCVGELCRADQMGLPVVTVSDFPGDDDVELPDYLNDLNAVREAEEQLLGKAWVETKGTYLGHIEQCAMPEIQLDTAYCDPRKAVFAIRHATAEQCVEALLKTFGKWEEAS